MKLILFYSVLYNSLRQTLFEKVHVPDLDLISVEDGAITEYLFDNDLEFLNMFIKA